MISIVICSRNSQLDEYLASNIKRTIGRIDYEIILIDNSENSYSIFSAYNIGFKKSKYPIVCFMHEDIEYRTQNWGQLVVNCFKNKDVGLSGIIGSKYISEIPCGWWLSKSRRGHIIEKRNNEDIREDFGAKKEEQVVTIDGLWFCIRKNLYPTISFDTKTFKGFHCYDMDISLQILKLKYQIQVIQDMELYHKSQGSTNDAFYFNCVLLYKKWRNSLPVSIDINDKEKTENIRFVNSCIKGISKENYFNRYTKSLFFRSIYTIEMLTKINMQSVYIWTYYKGFHLYVLLANNKYLRICL
jgi:GT2 family glycosyltransferase